jgi:hypothetical protein
MNTIPTIEGLDNKTANQKLLDDLILFENNYSKYLACINKDNKNQCVDTNIQQKNLRNLYYKIYNEINTNNKALNIYLPNKNDKSVNHDELMKSYRNDVIRIRKELDAKLNDLNDINSSIYSDYNKKYDSTVYGGILWTVLASSLLYYVFTQI